MKTPKSRNLQMLFTAERDGFAQFYRYHRDQQVENPLRADSHIVWLNRAFPESAHISTELHKNASMRPNVGTTGFCITQGTHNPILVRFGSFGIFGSKNAHYGRTGRFGPILTLPS